MGITISGPSTQIPTNVVEVGNEITQNQLNAITASSLPSTGNPLQTLSALQAYISANVNPNIYNKVVLPSVTWSHPFPQNGNFVLVYQPTTSSWWPWNQSNALIHTVSGGAYQNSYNFDFTDNNGNYISLNGSADVGISNTNYYTLGYWDNNAGSTYYSSSGNSPYSGTGPSYAGNWDNPINSAIFYDGMNWMYRYVYLDGQGGFYTADNYNNPPY